MQGQNLTVSCFQRPYRIFDMAAKTWKEIVFMISQSS